MATNSKNKFEMSEKYWVVSEVKASMIEVYNNFLSKQDMYIRSLKQVVDKTLSKAEYIAALYGFYTLMLNGYVQYLNNEEVVYSEEDYISLAISDEHEDEKLVRMGYLLQKWASTEGAFRITHQEKVYNDDVDKLLDEDEM